MEGIIIVLWGLFLVFTAILAEKKNRVWWEWALLALVSGPLAFLTVGLAPALPPKEESGGDLCGLCGLPQASSRYHSTMRKLVPTERGAETTTYRICTAPATGYAVWTLTNSLADLRQELRTYLSQGEGQ